MSIRKFHKRGRKSSVNVGAIAARDYNANIDHYRKLHHPDRHRSEGELETMRKAALKRPGGWAAKFLLGVLTRPEWAADAPNGVVSANGIAVASGRG